MVRPSSGTPPLQWHKINSFSFLRLDDPSSNTKIQPAPKVLLACYRNGPSEKRYPKHHHLSYRLFPCRKAPTAVMRATGLQSTSTWQALTSLQITDSCSLSHSAGWSIEGTANQNLTPALRQPDDETKTQRGRASILRKCRLNLNAVAKRAVSRVKYIFTSTNTNAKRTGMLECPEAKLN